MGYRQVIGFGSVWEHDSPDDHDAVGVFRWRLGVVQDDNNKLIASFRALGGQNMKWADGWYNFDSKLQWEKHEMPCRYAMVPDDDGSVVQEGVEVPEHQVLADGEGLEIMVVCTSTADGQAPKIGGKMELGASVKLPDTASIGPKLVFEFSPGYSGQKLTWLLHLMACPTKQGCPKITVLDHSASVSDSEYFWGDEFWPQKTTSGTVVRHMPQIAIGVCDKVLPVRRTLERFLPIDHTPHVERIHTADDGGIA